MSRAGVPLLSLVLVLAGCVNPVQIGEISEDGGFSNAETLQLLMQEGPWRGSATSGLSSQEIILDFGPSTYTVTCGCDEPFPSESVEDGSTGRWYITDYTPNGQGWGRAEHELPGGSTLQVSLEHIEFVGSDILRFERRRRGGPSVWVNLTRHSEP